MTVSVITDTAAALPAELVQQHRIGIVPLWLHVGSDSYRDGELPLEDLVARFDEPIKTAAPSPGEIIETIESAGRDNPTVVFTVASAMSSTHEAAILAARQAGGDIRVVDTCTAAGAQGLVVLHAARAAATGADADAVEAAARQAMERVRLIATVPDLDRLAQSGRVPDAARRIGNRVGVQPLFEFREGRARPLRPAFSREAALGRIVERCAAERDDAGALHVAVLHAVDDTAGDTLRERVDLLQPATCFVGPFSPVMVAHTGAGLAGLAWWSEP